MYLFVRLHGQGKIFNYRYLGPDDTSVLIRNATSEMCYVSMNNPYQYVYSQALNKKEHKNGACSPDSPEGDTEYQLTPRTEAKFSKIDEAFQMMMQKNQMAANNRVSIDEKRSRFVHAAAAHSLLVRRYTYIGIKS